MNSEQTRREFITNTGTAASAATLLGALTSLLQGCGGGSPTSASSAPPLPTVRATMNGGAATLAIDAGSPLAAVGGAALVLGAGGPLLVAHTAPDTFVALTAICTHQGCTISGFTDQRYVCPCHGSNFDTSGRVLNGPAAMALRQFPTSFASGVLTITL